jgi:hypothetical protein
MSQLATPISDDYFASLDPAGVEAIAAIDEHYLREEKARVASWVAEKLTTPTHSVQRRAQLWERLTVRILQDWPPDGTYLVDEYINDLDTRDSLEETANRLPSPVAAGFTAMLTRLDDAFREVTFEDGGESIAWRLNESRIDLALRPWWWTRRPHTAPWA